MMKNTLIVLCLAVASCTAVPTKVSHASALDLLEDLENLVREDGKAIIGKMLNVIHYVENALLEVKQLVPKAYEKVHAEADQVLEGLKKVTEEVEELIGKQKAYFGFDLLNGLTELSGGTKLGTALRILNLADKAHKVLKDAQEFEPNLAASLRRVQANVEEHVHKFASQVLKELGLQELMGRSVISKIEDLFQKVSDEGHTLILKLLHEMEVSFELLKAQFPEEYERVQKQAEEVRSHIHELITHVEQAIVMRSFSLLDLAGNLSGGTDMSTAFKVISLLDKFNTVMQDIKNFEPRAEKFLSQQMQKVAERAQTFFTHSADKLLDF